MASKRRMALGGWVLGLALLGPANSVAAEVLGGLIARVVPSTRASGRQGHSAYYGQALGATYYNWGYFGALDHTQLSRQTTYYGECRCGLSKGY